MDGRPQFPTDELPAGVTAPVSEAYPEAIELELTELQARIFDVMRQTAPPFAFFRRSDHDWSQLDDLNLKNPVPQSAYHDLLRRLEEADIVEHNGVQKGGSQYCFTERVQEPLIIKVAVASGRYRADSNPQSAETPATRIARQEERIRFAGALVTGIEARIADTDGDQVAVEAVANYIAEELELDVRRATLLISGLVGRKHFHYERVDGVKVLKPGLASETLPGRRKAEAAESSDWTPLDINFAKPVLELLINRHYLKNGAGPQELASDLGITDEARRIFFGTLSKLHRDGYIATKPVAGGAAEAKKSPIFYIANQDLVSWIREDPKGVIEQMRVLAGVPSKG